MNESCTEVKGQVQLKNTTLEQVGLPYIVQGYCMVDRFKTPYFMYVTV